MKQKKRETLEDVRDRLLEASMRLKARDATIAQLLKENQVPFGINCPGIA